MTGTDKTRLKGAFFTKLNTLQGWLLAFSQRKVFETLLITWRRFKRSSLLLRRLNLLRLFIISCLRLIHLYSKHAARLVLIFHLNVIIRHILNLRCQGLGRAILIFNVLNVFYSVLFVIISICHIFLAGSNWWLQVSKMIWWRLHVRSHSSSISRWGSVSAWRLMLFNFIRSVLSLWLSSLSLQFTLPLSFFNLS